MSIVDSRGIGLEEMDERRTAAAYSDALRLVVQEHKKYLETDGEQGFQLNLGKSGLRFATLNGSEYSDALKLVVQEHKRFLDSKGERGHRLALEGTDLRGAAGGAALERLEQLQQKRAQTSTRSV